VQNQSKQQIVIPEFDILEQSELYDVMPLDAEELSASSEKPNWLSPEVQSQAQPMQSSAPPDFSLSSESQTKSVTS